mgnify:CR=1 FL=1
MSTLSAYFGIGNKLICLVNSLMNIIKNELGLSGRRGQKRLSNGSKSIFGLISRYFSCVIAIIFLLEMG